MLDVLEHGEAYEPDARLHNCGRDALIEDLTPATEIVNRVLESGQSPAGHHPLKRVWPVSWSAVRRFAQASPVIFSHRRQTKKAWEF